MACGSVGEFENDLVLVVVLGVADGLGDAEEFDLIGALETVGIGR